jgi:hypothetical protein
LIQEAADRAARKIASTGKADEEVLRDAIDSLGTLDPETEDITGKR